MTPVPIQLAAVTFHLSLFDGGTESESKCHRRQQWRANIAAPFAPLCTQQDSSSSRPSPPQHRYPRPNTVFPLLSKPRLYTAHICKSIRPDISRYCSHMPALCLAGSWEAAVTTAGTAGVLTPRDRAESGATDVAPVTWCRRTAERLLIGDHHQHAVQPDGRTDTWQIVGSGVGISVYRHVFREWHRAPPAQQGLNNEHGLRTTEHGQLSVRYAVSTAGNNSRTKREKAEIVQRTRNAPASRVRQQRQNNSQAGFPASMATLRAQALRVCTPQARRARRTPAGNARSSVRRREYEDSHGGSCRNSTIWLLLTASGVSTLAV